MAIRMVMGQALVGRNWILKRNKIAAFTSPVRRLHCQYFGRPLHEPESIQQSAGAKCLIAVNLGKKNLFQKPPCRWHGPLRLLSLGSHHEE